MSEDKQPQTLNKVVVRVEQLEETVEKHSEILEGRATARELATGQRFGLVDTVAKLQHSFETATEISLKQSRKNSKLIILAILLGLVGNFILPFNQKDRAPNYIPALERLFESIAAP